MRGLPLPPVYLLRHGQTEWNVRGWPQGRLDSPLTDLGVRQARAHALTLSGVALARAYVSPMGRAQHTARLVLEGRDVPVEVLDDLAEVDAGSVSRLGKAERLVRFPEFAAARVRDKYRTSFPGGESYETAAPRVRRALERIEADGPGEVLIVSHEMTGKLLRMHLLGLPPEEVMETRHPQDVIYRVEGGRLGVLHSVVPGSAVPGTVP